MTDTTTPQTPAVTTREAGSVTAQGSAVAASARDQAATVAATAADEAKTVAFEAAVEAKEVLVDIRDQLRAQANEQSANIAALVSDIGGQLRAMAAAGETGVARDVVATVADQAQGIADRLGEGGLDRALDDARRLARNRPGWFLAGAALVGFVAARVTRSIDTDAVKRAASPNSGSNGTSGHGQPMPGQAPQVALEASTLTPGESATTVAAAPTSPLERSR